MAEDVSLADILRQGMVSWNVWRKEHPGRKLYLKRARLNSANLHGADLTWTDLTEANLRGADLTKSDLTESDLHNADLTKSDLCGAKLRYAKLTGANLRDTSLIGANLRDANICGAFIIGTIFADVDLRKTRGLVELEHWGPSHVDLYTVKLPQDGSALHFLRGTGVPDEWIAFYRAQILSPILYHSCFISYASHDETLARRLHADLQDRGVRCWFAPKDMKIGDKIRACIDEAIHLQDKLLLLLSEHAIASTWVEDEVEAALEKEKKQQREVLFPVCLDESVMHTSQAWAAKLRRARHLGDFTHWTDTQAYQQAFDRLLHDLKAETEEK